MVPMLANTKLKPNGPLLCGLQRLSAPNRSNRADRLASNRISAHGSDSKVVGDWFVVSWDRVPNPFDSESRSPPIDCWFGGSRQQLLHIAPIARARENFFVRKLFQANQVSMSIKLSTPDRSRMIPMLANTKLKPNGPLICGLQRLSAPNRSNRTDCSA